MPNTISRNCLNNKEQNSNYWISNYLKLKELHGVVSTHLYASRTPEIPKQYGDSFRFMLKLWETIPFGGMRELYNMFF